MKKIRIGIVGTGSMANMHAKAFLKIQGVDLVAACDTNEARLKDFARKYKIKECYTSVSEMLEKSKLDGLSNVTPDRFHLSTSLLILKKRIHLLCEKPLAENYRDALKLCRVAQKMGVIHMVNFSYRNASAIHKAVELVKGGVIGNLKHVQGDYLQSWLTSKGWGDWKKDPTWLWRLSTSHGSKGVLGDIGVHLIDFAMYPAGSIRWVNAHLHCFSKVKGDRVGEYRLDANDTALFHVGFANGALGSFTCTRFATGFANRVTLRLHGDRGAIQINLDESSEELLICRGKDVDQFTWKSVSCGKVPTIFQRFIQSIRTGKNEQPDFTAGLHAQRVIDACFESHQSGRLVTIKNL